mgnify:CR=1 FL=1
MAGDLTQYRVLFEGGRTMRKIIIPMLIAVALFLSGCAGESAEVIESTEPEAVTKRQF